VSHCISGEHARRRKCESVGVITNLTMFKRRPGLSVDAFRSYWQSTHRDLALQLPGLRHYVQHPTDDSGYRRHEPVYDGVAETTWNDLDDLRQLRGSAEISNVLADEPNLMDMARRDEIVTDDDVVVDGQPTTDALTMLVFVKRRADLSPESFHAYWRDVHGPLGAQVPGVRRYVQHHAIANLYRDRRDPVYDGVAQTWFDDLEAMRAAAGTEQLAATLDDGPNFITVPSPFVVCTSVVMR
jgi:uncharacterized protein (TIGR02118 family)